MNCMIYFNYDAFFTIDSITISVNNSHLTWLSSSSKLVIIILVLRKTGQDLDFVFWYTCCKNFQIHLSVNISVLLTEVQVRLVNGQLLPIFGLWLPYLSWHDHSDRWVFKKIFLLLFPTNSFEQSWICYLGI